ncbi:MAG TPA: electron transfer flavoprotein subunit beta/FixA family protein [Candidatus Limnocylindrales bacterium]|nr:electron transfer flavoprotein subunit beta/FixA family protein [Candidatus Limnocylindrales bacterium]
MKILICAKQVPDSTVRVKVAADGTGIATEGIAWAISPYDEYAIELALERKDADPATTVSVVSVGPARARDALRQALAMGCDDATLVTGAGAETVGGLALARALAAIVREAKPDLVLCGKQASDDEQGLVGPALADALGWPHLASVERMTPADGGVELARATEAGYEVWRASGPVVATVQKSEKEPRYPSLPGIMKAKKKEIPERDLASLGAADAPSQKVLRMEPPPARGGGKILKDGDARSLAAELARLLRDEAKVL